MTFEWDPRKADVNRLKHGVPFEEAMVVFDDPRVLIEYDEAHSRIEDRWLAFGWSDRGRILVVVHTYRAGNIRIISARKASRVEAERYGQA